MNIENKYVFKFFLNKRSVPTFITWLGRPTHNFGAQTENALSPYVFVLELQELLQKIELEFGNVALHALHLSVQKFN